MCKAVSFQRMYFENAAHEPSLLRYRRRAAMKGASGMRWACRFVLATSSACRSDYEATTTAATFRRGGLLVGDLEITPPIGVGSSITKRRIRAGAMAMVHRRRSCVEETWLSVGTFEGISFSFLPKVSTFRDLFYPTWAFIVVSS